MIVVTTYLVVPAAATAAVLQNPDRTSGGVHKRHAALIGIVLQIPQIFCSIKKTDQVYFLWFFEEKGD